MCHNKDDAAVNDNDHDDNNNANKQTLTQMRVSLLIASVQSITALRLCWHW